MGSNAQIVIPGTTPFDGVEARRGYALNKMCFSFNSADNRAQHYADTGLFLYVTPNVQLDVRIGERISHRVDGMFTGAGLSVRF